MDFESYIGFVQLAVAFNFAFVYIKGFDSKELFQGLFSDVTKTIKESYSTMQNNCNTLSSESLENLSVSNNDNEITISKIKNDTTNLISKVDIIVKEIDNRINMSPAYFNKICMALGLYSIFLLFILSDYKNFDMTNMAWPIFSFGIILYLFFHIMKELLIFLELKKKPKSNENLSVIIYVTILFISSYVLVYIWKSYISNLFIPLFEINTDKIKYVSIFIPYISFVICFFMHLYSVVYARIKLFLINHLIKKQEFRISLFIEKEKVKDIEFR